MKLMGTRRNRSIGYFMAAVVGLAGAQGGVLADAPTTVPATVPTATPTTAPSAGEQRSPRELAGAMAADQKLVNDLLGKNNASLKTIGLRQAVAPKLTPPLRRMVADLDSLAAAVPALKPQIQVSRLQLVAMLSLIGDSASADAIQALNASGVPADAATFAAAQWLEKWYAAGVTEAEQNQVVSDLQTLDRAYPDNEFLAMLTARIAKEAATESRADRMLRIAAEDMHNPVATQIQQELAAKKAAVEEDARVANKPLTLSGNLPDGQPFSTANLKGKVILVDFWATWCGPCMAEMPRVKRIYQTYHKDGLEVVGVSNDYNVESLKGMVARQDMPWPQLFDPKAAKNQEWNSITRDQKIDGIPVMYLIDRKGVLRTVNARLNMEELIPRLLAEPN